MEHRCKLSVKENHHEEKLRWYHQFIFISVDNPLGLDFFRSGVAVKKEMNRQMQVNRFAIHPFSKFRAWYEVFLIYLYASVLVSKPVDAGFVKVGDCRELHGFRFYQFLTDILCWIDIIINCFTGYEDKQVNMIELRRWNIIKKYIFGPYFLCDVLSSIPKCSIYKMPYSTISSIIIGLVSMLGMVKLIRVISFMKCIWKVTKYFRISPNRVVFIFCILAGFMMTLHWLACLQFALPRIIRSYFMLEHRNRNSWYYSADIYNGSLYSDKGLLIRYNHSIFITSACLLGIRLYMYQIKLPEEYILAICSYFTGKIIMVFIWIVLTVTILNSKVTELKFWGTINQLENYMTYKRLPNNLRNRLWEYFVFKYQKRYFEEELMTSLLSENLKIDMNMFICKSLIKNVSLFSDLSPIEVSTIVNFLILEIFLPNDTIIRAGSRGDTMYFMSSGTVAVYTHTGKEICHLHDGAYFGEISLILKNQLRSASVIALETSEVYKLKRKDFEICLLGNRNIMAKIMLNAEERLEETSRLEEEYKLQLLQRK